MKIAISSGKGGTGKTFVSTNLAAVFAEDYGTVTYLDCDVEEPNGHLFLRPESAEEEEVLLESPVSADPELCTACGKCADACKFNALALLGDQVLFFRNLCHMCGACTLVCPNDAIRQGPRSIGRICRGSKGGIDIRYGLLETGEGGMSPRLIRIVKDNTKDELTLLDSPPGTSCPVIETVHDCDICVLVTDPTPFGLNDLKLAVEMCRALGLEPAVVVNRAVPDMGDLLGYCQRESLEIVGKIPDRREIAECYAGGQLAVEEYPEYKRLFTDIGKRILRYAENPGKHASGKRRPPGKKGRQITTAEPGRDLDLSPGVQREDGAGNRKEIIVLSGKGGTGKTSLTACFCAIEGQSAISDCDVDAADLHLLLQPEIRERGIFSGGDTARIDRSKCSSCGRCVEACRFQAVLPDTEPGGSGYFVDAIACEGCGVCSLVCPEEAVVLEPGNNGEWFDSITPYGPMSHAKLGIAEKNSGKLVSFLKERQRRSAELNGLELLIVDGSPGTGCPVISSLSGADYAVVVTEPTVSGLHDLKRILEVIRYFAIPAGIIVNKYDLNQRISGEIQQLAETENIDMLGVLPYTSLFTEAQIHGFSLVEYEKNGISDSIRMMWDHIKIGASAARTPA